MLDFLKPKQDPAYAAYLAGARAARADRDSARAPAAPAPVPVASSLLTQPLIRYAVDDGEKFPGGFGATQLLTADYWTLRARSVQLFETNLYARGLIRRLINNEINTGLHLECIPGEKILGYEEDGLADWAEDVENRFEIWCNGPDLCDANELTTFGGLQRAARLEALISGDVLCVLTQDARTGLPRVRLISGACIQTPFKAKPQAGNRIKHGVEVDRTGRHVAFWILQEDENGDRVEKRVPAFGEKSGRRISWLVYGTEHRLDDVRGKPLLALILQALKELDRYKDAILRKAVINSILAMFIQKDVLAPGTNPMAAGASRYDEFVEAPVDGGAPRSWKVASHAGPGVTMDELQVGEKPVAFQSNIASERFGEFEKAVLSAIAWANEIPPENLMLSFDSNYSASQAANNEFKIYLNRIRTEFGIAFCQPIYVEWLLSQLVSDRIEARGLIEAWGDWKKYDIFGAWTQTDWSGQIKPSIDQMKLVNSMVAAIDAGLITRDRAARELNGTKYSRNAQKLKRENEALALALKPIAALETPPAPANDESADEADRRDAADAAKRKAS